jgi:hypothetical protein
MAFSGCALTGTTTAKRVLGFDKSLLVLSKHTTYGAERRRLKNCAINTTKELRERQ